MKAYGITSALENAAATTELIIDRRPLTELPEQLFALPELRRLQLSNCQLEKLPGNIGQLKNLEILDLSGNNLAALPPECGELIHLETLILDHNTLTEVPAFIRHLPCLKVLKLAGNRLRQLPAWLFSTEKLELLDLSDNQLILLPRTVGNAKSLRRLFLQKNSLKALPAGIKTLKNLEELDLSSNQFKRLPNHLDGLEKLAVLRAGHNALKTLPESLQKCLTLREIDVRYNAISRWPVRALQAPWLAYVYLAGNKLSSVPGSVSGCLKVKRLDLNNNNLKTFPVALGTLPQLHWLNVEDNRITRIQWAEGRFPALEHFLARGNKGIIPAEALLKLPAMTSVTGVGWEEAEDHRMSHFLALCRYYKIPAADRWPLWKYIGLEEAIHLEDLPYPVFEWLLSLPLPAIAVKVRTQLYQSRPKPLTSGSVISPAGRCLSMPLGIVERLDEQGVRWNPEITDETTHVLLGDFPGAPPPIKALSYLNEQQLLEWLYTRERSYLAIETSAEKWQTLEAMLQSNDRNTLHLALRLLKGGGLPRGLLSQLKSTVERCTDPALQTELESFLLPHLSDPDRLQWYFRKAVHPPSVAYFAG